MLLSSFYYEVFLLKSEQKNYWKAFMIAKGNFETIPKMSAKMFMSTIHTKIIKCNQFETIHFLFWETLFLQIISTKNDTSYFLVWSAINNSCWWKFGQKSVLMKKFKTVCLFNILGVVSCRGSCRCRCHYD